jgi:hypothetical protein
VKIVDLLLHDQRAILTVSSRTSGVPGLAPGWLRPLAGRAEAGIVRQMGDDR